MCGGVEYVCVCVCVCAYVWNFVEVMLTESEEVIGEDFVSCHFSMVLVS